MTTGFVSSTDLWWWCEDHKRAELNPPGLHGGEASVGHRWVGPFRTQEQCEESFSGAVAGPGHVVDVPVSASEPNPPKAGR